MAEAPDSRLVTDRLGNCLAECDADVFDGVVGVNLKIAASLDIEVDQPMTADLVEHVVKKRDAAIEPTASAAIEIERYTNLGFLGRACNLSGSHRDAAARCWLD